MSEPIFIVVEGNDCTGKSTLVSELRSSLRFLGFDTKNLVHRPGDQYMRYLREYLNADRIVFNRGHYSELVYGDVLRNEISFSKTELESLQSVINKFGIVIYCDLSPKEIEARMLERNKSEMFEDDVENEIIEQVDKNYKLCFKNVEYIQYIPKTKKDLTEVLFKIKSIIQNKTNYYEK